MPIVGRPFLLGSGNKGFDFGANDAVLRVKCSTGATVVATKGVISRTFGIVFPSSDSNWSYYYCNIKPSMFDSENSWTISVAYDGVTITKDVLINESSEYYIYINDNVPIGYTQYTYIQFPGQVSISIPNPWENFSFSETYDLTITHGPDDKGTSRYPGLFGGYSGTTRAYVYPGYRLSDSNTTSYKGYIFGPGTTTSGYQNQRVLFDRTDTATDIITLKISGRPSGSAHLITVSGSRSGSFTSNVAIGSTDRGFQLGSSGIGATNGFGGKVYLFKLTRGGTPAFDLIPCKNASDEFGFYDKVKRTFYTATGLTGGGEIT